MRQRLGLAGALLADPRVLLLDEPANGLDPEGIAWLRGFLRHLAGQGRTILVSSHVLSEVQQTVDDVVIIARGRLVRASTLADLEGAPVVLARSPRATALVDALRVGRPGRRRSTGPGPGPGRDLRPGGGRVTRRTARASSCTSCGPRPATWSGSSSS